MDKQSVFFIKEWTLNKLKSNLSFKSDNRFYTFIKKIINLSDSPKKIASGVALGLAFDFLPIPIISIPLSYLVARTIRCNPIAAVTTVILFKLAVPSFYILDYFVGKTIYGEIPGPDIFNTGISVLDIFLDKLFEHGYPFVAGSLINAAIAWVVTYIFSMFLLKNKTQGIKVGDKV